MTDANESRRALFREVVRLWQQRESDVADQLTKRPGNWLTVEGARELYSLPHREEIIMGMQTLYRQQFITFMHSLMAAFDAATELADAGVVLTITDQDDQDLGSDLHVQLMEYLMEIGWQ